MVVCIDYNEDKFHRMLVWNKPAVSLQELYIQICKEDYM